MAVIRCAMCGEPNPDDLEFCQWCEARLRPLSASSPDDLPIQGEGEGIALSRAERRNPMFPTGCKRSGKGLNAHLEVPRRRIFRARNSLMSLFPPCPVMILLRRPIRMPGLPRFPMMTNSFPTGWWSSAARQPHLSPKLTSHLRLHPCLPWQRLTYWLAWM